jgi:catechol 2,3-dioxygenase-like lactoylglutathione lyase family enzyme
VAVTLIDGVTAALVGVSDRRAHIDLYCGRLGFDVVDEGVIGAAAACALWGDGLPDLAVTVLAAAGAPTGRIALVNVGDSDVAPAVHPHTTDIGLAGIDLYTRDIGATHRDLVSAGYLWVAPPATYDVPLGERQVTVTEGICQAPDGTDLVFVQPANPRGTVAWAADPHRAYTELTSVVCHVSDVDSEISFWGPSGLGLDLWYDVTFSAPGLDRMANLPLGSRLRLAFLVGATTARIEVTSVLDGAAGKDRRPLQRPGRSLGHSGWIVRTRDLDTALAQAVARGARRIAGPVPTDDPLLGTGRAASMDSPGGIPVTLYQPASGPRT